MNNHHQPDTRFDVVGIGNAIVDVLGYTDDAMLQKQGLAKGSMMLVDEARVAELYEHMGPTTECSGGSVANSLAGLASLGGRAAFIGKVRNDQMGNIFTHDLHAVGVHFNNVPATNGAATARCLVFVTPDAQRTMATYIGACSMVGEGDIEASLIQSAAITYIEGYLWDTQSAKASIRKAIALAKAAGRKVALTLSDTFCVERHRDEFMQLVKHDVDVLFANESEARSLFQTDDTEVALGKLQGICTIAVVTRSEKGCVVLTSERVEHVSAHPVANVMDTTGAGDLFASGFLYGLSKGWELSACGALGNQCAGEIITQLGARSLKPLNRLVA